MSSQQGSPNRSSDTASLKVYLRLLGYVKPYWVSFLISVLGFIVYSASQPAMAQYMEYLLNFIESEERGPLWLPSLIILAIIFVRGFGGFLGNFFIAKVSYRVVDTLRVQLFSHMVYLPAEYYERNDSGQLMSLVTFNVNNVTTASTEALKTMIREGTTVIALLGYLFYKDWVLTLLMMAVVPLIAALVGYVGKRLRRLSTKVQHSMGDITQVTSEMINGYRVMRSFGGEEYEKRRFAEASWRNYLQNLKIVLTSTLNTPLIQILVAIAMGGLLWVALGQMQIQDSGAFVAYFLAVGMVLKPMRQLSEMVPVIQKGVAAADSIFQVLDEKPEQDDGIYRPQRVSGALSIRDLHFTYDGSEREAIKGIDLDIEPGQVVALVGKSGSGKSTLMNLLTRFYHGHTGSIRFDDKDINEFNLASLRAQIALVTQQVVLFNDSVAANIAYGALDATEHQTIKQAAELAYASEFIEQLPQGYDTVIGEGGAKLSGGQRQRLAIARAILKDAPILILDEATSALDNESERYIQRALETVSRGRTTIVVAHRLSTIENADVIVVMDEGTIVEQGSHSELLAKQGYYARLHSATQSDSLTL
ncbi:lipid A export permease/ATP-binding protein MsbA [Gilvimarinus xylanilyticus]|uniref:Lipid A export permease/ATP-binding protein MsbA n=1 Tax=Gilvimarinus xylanilyticus TaxID=2944139 RepID=A0A9X2I8I5_9GAMM|nr:lipid A export permease/ATP-binding protein MsbA [Gilvimarinus xylanilyticus]MCP8900722.1 lipid A export permease/ATP-binding protein MsbA [Gilvimarinus xylanilyticus]